MSWERLYPTPKTMYLGRHLVGVAVAALCLGLAAGGAVVYEMVPTREPKACAQARELTDDYIIGQANLLSAVREQASAVDFISRGEADDKVSALVEKLEPIGTRYDATFKACEEATR